MVTQIWANWAKIGSDIRVFCHFLKFGLLVFFDTAYNSWFQQYITSRRGKIMKKKRAKIGYKIRFFDIFPSLLHQFSLKLHRMIAWNNVSLQVEIKPTKKIGDPNLSQMAKIRPKLKFVVIILSLVHQLSWKLHRIAWNIV